MSTLKELAAEYRTTAAQLAVSIKKKKNAGTISLLELRQLYKILRELRETARLLSGYYDSPRPKSYLTLVGMKARRTRDDH